MLVAVVTAGHSASALHVAATGHTAYFTRLSTIRRSWTSIAALCRSTLPPPLPNADHFGRGELDCGWWRQDAQRVQLVIKLPEDATFKRDVIFDLSRKKFSLKVKDNAVLVGDLEHEIDTASSEWFVEDEFETLGRVLLIELQKRESFVDWSAPLKPQTCSDAAAPRRRLLIGGKGEAQKEATMQQLASYQILQKLPTAVRGDVYARAPSAAGGPRSTTLYFVGKVIAEALDASLSLAAQEVLVKEHARLYLPSVFSGVDDADIELWLAPGNTEVRVAQNELDLRLWQRPADEAVRLPEAGACGFQPETATPEHMGGQPFSVQRNPEGKPLGKPFDAKIMSPDKVPGAYEAWLSDQL